MGIFSEVSGILGIDMKTLEKESLRTYLKKKMKEYNAEILEICRKYGVKSAKEFEELYKSGKLDEENTLDDFFRLDYLESQIEKIKTALRELGD
ncbi:hypothetical protein [Archaeoglobus neptunius]|uniref:hypothetical protein n=1 Tax=Archaeoglobus neptunius TaxID=2798580 RepID=UPI0019274D0F|nr:hypothetical protein [Archaeoglobus neptunius]